MKAFPIHFKHHTTGLIVEHLGMDLRDYFASVALPMVMDEFAKEDATEMDYLLTAGIAYDYADAMMKAREVKNV